MPLALWVLLGGLLAAREEHRGIPEGTSLLLPVCRKSTFSRRGDDTPTGHTNAEVPVLCGAVRGGRGNAVIEVRPGQAPGPDLPGMGRGCGPCRAGCGILCEEPVWSALLWSPWGCWELGQVVTTGRQTAAMSRVDLPVRPVHPAPAPAQPSDQHLGRPGKKSPAARCLGAPGTKAGQFEQQNE